MLQAHDVLLEGKGGRIPTDFGCAMVLAALGATEAEAAPGTGALEALLAKLPEDSREAVRERLRGAHGDGSKRHAAQLRDTAMKFRLREPDNDGAAGEVPTRVAFSRSGDDIRAAAITNTTTVTERTIPQRAPLVERACERLHRPDPKADPQELAQHAASLFRMLVPADLREVLSRLGPLVIEVDRALAKVQWEMLPGGVNREPLGLTRDLSRQLRTYPDGRRTGRRHRGRGNRRRSCRGLLRGG